MASNEPSTQVIDGSRLRRRGDRVRSPTFTMIEGPGIGMLHVLDPSRRAHRIGRADDADIQIQAPSVSRVHAVAVLASREGSREVRIDDNDSTNGLKVNGLTVRTSWLVTGDKVRLGDVLLRFQWMTDDEIQYASGVSSRLIEAAKDPLTGLLTRAYVNDRLPSQVFEADRRKLTLCCVLFDLDHFKKINDVHGHLVGDAVIRRAATAVSHSVRNDDLVVRYGGEEFLILMRDTDTAEAIEVASRVRTALKQVDLSDLADGLVVTASLGIAERGVGEAIQDWIDRADQALYTAKSLGRDRFEIAPASEPFGVPDDDTDNDTLQALVEELPRPTLEGIPEKEDE